MVVLRGKGRKEELLPGWGESCHPIGWHHRRWCHVETRGEKEGTRAVVLTAEPRVISRPVLAISSRPAGLTGPVCVVDEKRAGLGGRCWQALSLALSISLSDLGLRTPTPLGLSFSI